MREWNKKCNNDKHFLAAMYLRLSRDDNAVFDAMDAKGATSESGMPKLESNSIGNQRELIRSFIHGQQDMELYDSYIDV